MPSAKLTLRLDKDVIERGKRYARKHGTSLSRLFEQYLQERTRKLPKPPVGVDVDPDVLALMLPNGAAGSFATDTPDFRTAYYDHVANKHLTEEE